MTFRCIIFGGREFEDYEYLKNTMDKVLADTPNGELIIISGAARGADYLGEEWARERGIPYERYPADWKRYGKSAGYKRNLQMAEVADMAVGFEGGPGTTMMFDILRKKNIPFKDARRKDVPYPPHPTPYKEYKGL